MNGGARTQNGGQVPQREHLDSNNFESLLKDYKQIADSSDDGGSATAALMQNEAITIGDGSIQPMP